MNSNRKEANSHTYTIQANSTNSSVIFDETGNDVLVIPGDARRFEVTDGQLQIFRSEGEALTFVPR